MFKKRYTRVDIDSILTNLSGKYGLSPDVLKLVEMDLCSGMTRDDVLKYCTKPISVGRMKVISECIRNGCSDDVIDKLSAEERSDEVMKVVFSLLDKGVKLATFEDKLGSEDRLLDFLNDYIEKMPEPKVEDEPSKEDSVEDGAGGHHIDTAVIKDELKGLLFELKAELMAGINSAIGKNAASEEKIRKECADMLYEAQESIKEKDHRITELEQAITRLTNTQLVPVVMPQTKEVPHVVIPADASEKTDAPYMRDGGLSEVDGKTLNITDAGGKVIGSVPIEHNVKKTSALGALAATIGIKKRSRRSLMQLAINGELCKEQLIHIVEAIRLGLTESQLCNLIENKVPAERMPSIIEIAKLENEMGYNA